MMNLHKVFSVWPFWLKILLIVSLGIFRGPELLSAAIPNPLSSIPRQASTDFSEDGKIPVIVRLRGSVEPQAPAVPTRAKGPARAQARTRLIETMQARAERNRQPLMVRLHRHEIQKIQNLWLINGLAFEATPAQVEELAAMPEVASITFDQRIRLPATRQDQPDSPAEFNIDLVHAPPVWAEG